MTKAEKLQQQVDELAADMLALREEHFPELVEKKQPPPETDSNPWGTQ